MRRQALVQVCLIIAGLLGFPLLAQAGGWAVVTLDALPVEPRAGQTLHLGFMVRQHGVTPIDTAFDVEPMRPRLSATNTKNGTSIEVDARKEGPRGHFVVDVTFPGAGTWEWQIRPDPFPPTQLGHLTILPAAAISTQPDPAVGTGLEPSFPRATLRWVGALMLLVAGGLALAGRSGIFGHRRPSAPVRP